MSTRGALAGIRVLDFTWALAGPFATMQLSDLGAEVVKVEHPTSTERERGAGPYVDDISTFFFSLNRGKRGVAIDLKRPRGRELALRLAGAADVVAENFRPGTMDNLGLGYESLRRENPRIIYAALSGFGQSGPYSPYAAVDAVAQAMGGTMSLNGEPDRPPVRVGVSIGDMVAGLFLALGTLAALRFRDATGEGQLLDVSMMEAQMALCENAIVRHSAFGEEATRVGNRHPLIAPFGRFEAADGYIVIANVKQWDLFCALLERDDLAFDARFTTNEARLQNVDALEPVLNEALRRRPADDWLAVLREANVCSVGKIHAIGDLFADPHVRARQALVEVPLPYGLPGALALPASPMRFSATPADEKRPMPGHGQHTDAVLSGWLGLAPDEIEGLRSEGVIR